VPGAPCTQIVSSRFSPYEQILIRLNRGDDVTHWADAGPLDLAREDS
jgi:hypothetical protein